MGQLCLARVDPLPRRAQASFPGPGPKVGFPPVRELSRLVELLLCPSLLIQKLSERLEWRRPEPPAQLAAVEWQVRSLPADFPVRAQRAQRASFRKPPGQRWFPKWLSLLPVRPKPSSPPAWFRLAAVWRV